MLTECLSIVAGLTGAYGDIWTSEAGGARGAGWACVAFIWLYSINFGYSWGPVAWIIISEVFPLGMRAKGVSIGGSSNWLNNVSPFQRYDAINFSGFATDIA